MRNRLIVPIFAAAALAIASAAFAHHGWSGYGEIIEMTVTVTELKLSNPHDRLIVEDASGQEWNLLLAPPVRNRRFGFGEHSVSVGDEIGLYGQKHPRRNEVKVHCLYRDGETIYTYRYDNGRMSLARSRTASRQSC